MQTFLVYPSFERSMSCLDPKRLGNQVYREGITLLRGKWPNHPASKMWRGYEYALCEYLIAGLKVLKSRGYDYPHIRDEIWEIQCKLTNKKRPWWTRSRKFHLAHRSNLIRKLPDWYGPMWPEVPDDLPYIWPEPEHA